MGGQVRLGLNQSPKGHGVSDAQEVKKQKQQSEDWLREAF
jgi:hypothetical protein